MTTDLHFQRRKSLLEAISPGVLVVPSAPVAIRNNDVEHDYRQDSDLFYLTGFDEPESVLVLSSSADEDTVMFVRPRDPEREVWDGARAGLEGAKNEFGAGAAYAIGELDKELPKLLEGHTRVFYRLGLDRAFDDKLLRALDSVRARAKHGAVFPTEIVDPGTVLHVMRLIKSPRELALMSRAVDITKDAHLAAMAQTKPGIYEYEVEALMRSIFRKQGSERPAYAPIVGSGPNATVLHYRKNDRKMGDGELLLIDAGCEYGYYASDVTRTFPVGGRFSNAQRAIYEIVLEAQLASIEATKPGATLDDVHQKSVEVITRGLVDLGIIEGPADEAITENRYKPYYMHRTSHYIGMDVHDVGPYFIDGKPRPLENGIVITVEPGIYIAAGAEDAPAEYRGIGVRIEDDVLVTEQGHQVLSDGIPKTVADVERACAA